uniref:NADH dehydrogenase subunit 5 n=1 Tax=Vietnamella sinensis TaxID=2758365 RepID=UPI002176C225|nr:NADH dehydrogenase subunit 5 [Vietnamella sinensis]UUL99601.1 NADH dehydrogenase subunit 5 [Vietnamella sinensis]UUL99627.1 NADH dehydrogenase subunit 5 [Vietnamella sinensis]
MLNKMCICKVSFIFLMLVSLTCFYEGLKFLLVNKVIFIEWEVVNFQSSNVVMTVLLDWMSLLFMGLVLFISSLVIYYSEEYMSGDYNMNRFILLVLMFVLSMMFLIISPNLISILLGWDGLGLVSYCLVIYYQNVKSYNAGMLTALSNRVGDVALLMAIAWMLNFGSFNYIFYLTSMKDKMEMMIIGSLVILAAMTKSAQIPFSAWLPAAMAAPTPVSALVHSSTLVTAGIYLLIRFSPLLGGSMMNKILLLIAGLTMFMAGLGANFEFDLKKIIALSTLSQLGLMMSILAMGLPKLAYFHLLTHAMFKALLFMCAGAIIHNMKDSQDIRNMGNLVTGMPYTTGCLNVANMALCGFPFLAGFYSKDLILEVASLSSINMLSYWLYFISTGLTMCYTLRLSYYSLTGVFHLPSCHPVNDESYSMSYGMTGLLFLSVVGGSILMWELFTVPMMVCLPLELKTLALTVTVVGAWLGYEIAKFSMNIPMQGLKFYKLVSFWGSMWFMPLLFTLGVSKSPLKMGDKIIKSGDQGWTEMFGAQGMFMSFIKISSLNQWVQRSDLKIYLFTFVLWFTLLMLLL